MNTHRRLISLLFVALAIGCEDGDPSSPEPAIETRWTSVDVEGWTFEVPEGWITEEPQSRSLFFPRLLQIRLSGEGGAGDGQLIAVKTTGSADANVERWKGQFDATAEEREGWREESVDCGGQTCRIILLRGTYHVPPFSREEGQPEDLAGHAMLGALLEIDSVIAFRAVGPWATIEHHRDRFRAFFQSARRGD